MRKILPALVGVALLAGCGGGGSTGPSSQSALPAAGSTATGLPASGTITIVGGGAAGTSSLTRKPLFISAGTSHAAVFVDAITAVAGQTSSCTPASCVIAYTTSSGTHTLSAETDNGSKVLAEGTTGSQTIVAGPGNNFTITMNGAAAQFSWVSNTGSAPVPPAQPTSITANWAVADATANVITNAPAAAAVFDGGTITFAVAVAGLTGATPTFAPTTLAAPNAVGNNYSFTANCNGATGTGTFTITATIAGASGVVTAGQLAGLTLTYPALTQTPAHSYTCTSGVISDSSGNATLQ